MNKDRLGELAKLIHRTAEGQGWGCYHPAPGMAGCVGMARSVLTHFKHEENAEVERLQAAIFEASGDVAVAQGQAEQLKRDFESEVTTRIMVAGFNKKLEAIVDEKNATIAALLESNEELTRHRDAAKENLHSRQKQDRGNMEERHRLGDEVDTLQAKNEELLGLLKGMREAAWRLARKHHEWGHLGTRMATPIEECNIETCVEIVKTLDPAQEGKDVR